MITNTDDKPPIPLFVLFLFYLSFSSVSSYSIENNEINSYSNLFEDETIPPCIPCDTSIHHTLKVLNHVQDIDKINNESCFHKGIISLMMNYYKDEGELDLGVSIIPPFEYKDKWCRFHVYWKNQIQATFLLNQNKSMKSNNPIWSLHSNTGNANFWLVKKMTGNNLTSGNVNILI